jgi:hypothetical protein
MQTPSGFEPDLDDLADNAGEALVAKPLLHGGRDIGVAIRFRVDDAVGVKTGPRNTRREEIARMHAPQHRPPEAGQNARQEKRRQSAVVMTRARFRDLVQGSESETAAWEAFVDLLDSKWQHAKAPPSLCEPVKVLAQLKKN